MKHASPQSLQVLEPLLARIRGLDGIVERKPGLFYTRSSAFLHFHEDEAGLFADAKLDGVEFKRMRVSLAGEREACWQAISLAWESMTLQPGRKGKRHEL